MEILSLFLCLAGGVQGFALIIALNKLFREKNVDRKWLLLFLGVVSVTLMGRPLYMYPDVIDVRLPVLTDIVLYLYGPLYFFFLQSVFSDTSVNKAKKPSFFHFIPALIHVLITIPLFLDTQESYLVRMSEGQLTTYFTLIMVTALIHNFIYWWWGNRLIASVRNQYDGLNVSLSARYVLFMQRWYLGILIGFFMTIVWYQFNQNFAAALYQLVWILASWITYGLGYYVMSKPETFGDVLVDFKAKRTVTAKEKRQLEKVAEKLLVLLEEKRIFLDPDISLLSLAKQLNTNNVLLSKTINQQFNMGFYDLINKYRVQEFIRLVQDPQNSHFTYYALALQAGFNSKTSFNKYFKKVTKQTPKEYFRKLSVA
ncbi:MAG: hypothetical protein Tsb0034_13190 [Ekhidna sp.]